MFRREVKSISDLLNKYLCRGTGGSSAAKAHYRLMGDGGGQDGCVLYTREVYQEPDAVRKDREPRSETRPDNDARPTCETTKCASGGHGHCRHQDLLITQKAY